MAKRALEPKRSVFAAGKPGDSLLFAHSLAQFKRQTEQGIITPVSGNSISLSFIYP